MKKQLVIIGITVLLICVGLSGCNEPQKWEEEKESYNYVIISIYYGAYVHDSDGLPRENVDVLFNSNKELYNYLEGGVTGPSGMTKQFYHTYDMYENQTGPLIISAEIIGSNVTHRKSRSLSWNDIPNAGKESLYIWYCDFEFVVDW